MECIFFYKNRTISICTHVVFNIVHHVVYYQKRYVSTFNKKKTRKTFANFPSRVT